MDDKTRIAQVRCISKIQDGSHSDLWYTWTAKGLGPRDISLFVIVTVNLTSSDIIVFKGTPWDEDFFNFEKLFYIKLYSLLILTKKFKATENSYISRSYIAM